jgi:hypothetical protein
MHKHARYYVRISLFIAETNAKRKKYFLWPSHDVKSYSSSSPSCARVHTKRTKYTKMNAQKGNENEIALTYFSKFCRLVPFWCIFMGRSCFSFRFSFSLKIRIHTQHFSGNCVFRFNCFFLHFMSLLFLLVFAFDA